MASALQGDSSFFISGGYEMSLGGGLSRARSDKIFQFDGKLTEWTDVGRMEH